MDNLTLKDACKFKHLNKLKGDTKAKMVAAPQSLQSYLNRALMSEFNSNLFGICAGLLDNKFTAEQATEVIYAMPAHRAPKGGEIERAVSRIYNAEVDGESTDSAWPLPKKVEDCDIMDNLKRAGIEPMSEEDMIARLGESPEEADNAADFIKHYFNGLNDPPVYIGGQRHGAIQHAAMWLADSESIEALGYDQVLANPMRRLLTAEERASIKSGGRHKDFYSETLDVVTFESDKLPDELQFGAIEYLSRHLPLVSIVYSGGKSYHATYSLKGLSREQVDAIRQALVNIGADRSVLAPHQLVRLGGVNRSDKGYKLQRVLWIDPDARTRAVEAGKLSGLLGEGEKAEVEQTEVEQTEAEQAAQEHADEELWQFIQERQYNEMNVPEYHPPLVGLKGVGVVWQQNVHTIVAQSKAGKTRCIAALIRTIFTGERTLGWTVDNPSTASVVYLDFEQDEEDFYDLMCRHAGVTGSQVHAHRLAGLDAHKAQRAAELVIERTPNVRLLIIDGYADLSRDVNSQEEAIEIVQKWMDIATRHNVAILGVLHLNPGSDTKSRGHLGSQLERKSKTVLQIDVDSEGVRETYTYLARKQPVPKGHGASWQWSEAECGFVEITETRAEARQKDKEAKLRDELRGVINRFDDDTHKWTYTDLVEAAMEELNLKDRASKNRIKRWVESGYLVRTADDLYKEPDPY